MGPPTNHLSWGSWQSTYWNQTWSVEVQEEEGELIDFLPNHKAEAGDGANFKQTIWAQAAAHMSALYPNVAFSTNQCLSK